MPDWVQGWQQVQPLTDKSIDLLTRSLGNLSNAWQGLGNSGINYLQREIDRRDLIDAKNRASNTQLILSKLNQADTLEDKERLLNAGYADFGAIRSMLNNGDFDERVINQNLSRWNTDISNRYTANQNLLQSTPEGEKAKIDAQYAIATGNLEGMQQALKNPYLDPTVRQQLLSASVGIEAQKYTRGVEENLRRFKEEETQREIQRDATNKKNLAFGEYLKGISADKEYISLMQQEIGGLFSYYSYRSPNNILNDYKSSDQEKVKKANDFKQHFLQLLAKSPEKSNEIINAFLKGYGESAEYYGVDKEDIEAEKQEFLKFLGIELPKTNTNTGSENKTTTTTTPTVSDTPEKQAILDTVNKKEKDIKDIIEQKAKGFTKPYANFKNEEERNKYYDNLLSKTEKELIDARNKLTEYDAKQNQTTNNQTTIELSKEDEEKIADIRKQILNLKDDNTLSTEGKNAKAYELNQQIEDIVAKTYPKKEEGVVNNATPTTTNTSTNNTATNNITVNSGSNENLVVKSSEPEKIDNSIPATNTNTSNTNTATATTNNNNVSSGSNESLTTKADKGEQDKINAEIDADIKKSLSGSTLNEQQENIYTPKDAIDYNNHIDKVNSSENQKLSISNTGKSYQFLLTDEKGFTSNKDVKTALADSPVVRETLQNLSDSLPKLPEKNNSSKRGVKWENDQDYTTSFNAVDVKNKINKIEGEVKNISNAILNTLNRSYLYLEEPSNIGFNNLMRVRKQIKSDAKYEDLRTRIDTYVRWALGGVKGEDALKEGLQHDFLDDQWAVWFSEDRAIRESLINGKFIKMADNGKGDSEDLARFKLELLFSIKEIAFPEGYGSLSWKKKGEMEDQLTKVIPAIANFTEKDKKNIEDIIYNINNPKLVGAEVMKYITNNTISNNIEPSEHIPSLAQFATLRGTIKPSGSISKPEYDRRLDLLKEEHFNDIIRLQNEDPIFKNIPIVERPLERSQSRNFTEETLKKMRERNKKYKEDKKNLDALRY